MKIKKLNKFIKKEVKKQLSIYGVIVSLPPYKKCDCTNPLKCQRICHDLIERSGNAL